MLRAAGSAKRSIRFKLEITGAAFGGLEFVDEIADQSDGTLAILVEPVEDDLAATLKLRAEVLLPALNASNAAGSGITVLDFKDVRFLSTSIATAWLSEAFRTPGSLTKLIFRNCSKPTELAIRTVAAFAKAGYERRPE